MHKRQIVCYDLQGQVIAEYTTLKDACNALECPYEYLRIKVKDETPIKNSKYTQLNNTQWRREYRYDSKSYAEMDEEKRQQHIDRVKKWQEKNKDKVRKYQKKYQSKNRGERKEKAREYQRKYYAKNKDKVIQRVLERYHQKKAEDNDAK